MTLESRYAKIISYLEDFCDKENKYNLLDIGAGDKVIEAYLPGNIIYHTLDFGNDNNPGIKEKQEYTYLFDLDKGALPIESNIYDFIICYETLEHTMYPERVLKEIVRIGKKSCIFFLSLPNEYNFVQRVYYLFQHKSMTDEPFQVVEKHLHIHKPRVKDIIALFERYIKINKIIYVWQSSNLSMSVDNLIDKLGGIIPSLFSRVVIVFGEKK